jgi:aspartate-semialdehyde dehydrogenase
MLMKKVGLVGWRGMVGSVLMQRMVEEGDFAHIEPVYFSTSAPGGKAPVFGGKEGFAAACRTRCRSTR